MNKSFLRSALPAALAATLLLAGCKEPPLPPVEPIPEPVPEATTAPVEKPAAAAAVSVATVELGKALSGGGMIIEPMTTFASTDKIHASVTTMTTAPGATVTGKLAARWTDPSGHVVGEPMMAKDFSFTGPGITTFTLESEKPWQPGNYRVEIMLDNVLVATREFAIVR